MATPWVFRRLAARASDGECSSRIRLNIPPTIIFNDDYHDYLLTTAHDGKLYVQELSPTLPNGHDEDTPRRMKRAVETIRDLQQQKHSATNHVVWYADNGHEILDPKVILNLAASTSWRRQFCALQGHVVPHRVEYGVYRASENDLFGASGSMREGAANVGLNVLTAAIAKCVMGTLQAGANKRTLREEHRKPTSLSPRGQEVSMEFMKAIYAIDDEGVLWFSHVTGMHLRPAHAADLHAKPSREAMKNGDGNTVPPAYINSEVLSTPPQPVDSAEGRDTFRPVLFKATAPLIIQEPAELGVARGVVASELKRVLRKAIDKGASIEELFAHFDPLNSGSAGSCALQEGLTKLGIGISSDLADDVLQELGGTSHFTASDLARFVRKSSSNGQAQVRLSAKSARLHKKKDNVAGVWVRDSCVVVQKNKIARRRHKVDIEDMQQKRCWTNPNETRQRVSSSTRKGHVGEETAPSKTRRVGSFSRASRPKFRWDELPCWARQTSRSALRELLHHHQRSLQKARADTTPDPVILATSSARRINTKSVSDDGFSSTTHCRPLRPRSAQNLVSDVETHTQPPYDKGKRLTNGELKVHVGGGNVMSYRWVERAVARPNHGGNTLQALDALNTSQEAMGLAVAQHEPFLLVAMPDLFMTLDSMERWLGGLLERNSRGKLLLVGSLGLPGTQWTDGHVLHAKNQAHGLSALLWELLERGELCLSSAGCVVLLGFGPGANAVLNFAGTFLMEEKFIPLRNSTRFLVLVNPLPTTPDASPETQQVRRQLQVLKKTLQRADHHEQQQSLIATMFSAEYTEKSGRASVLEDFWVTRQGLQLPVSTRPRSAPSSSRFKNGSSSTPREDQACGTRPKEKNGVLECIDGVLHGATSGELDSGVDVPVLIVTSTLDALDSTNTAEHCRASLNAEDVDSVFKLVSGNKHRRVLVYPIQAGREVLQEAPSRTLDVIAGAIFAAQAQPIVTRSTGTRHFEERWSEKCVSDDTTGFHVDDPGSHFSTNDCSSGECIPTHEVKHPNDTPEEDDDVVEGYNKCSPPLPERDEHYITSPKGRRAREFGARKERAAERKAKNERLKRKQELDRLKRVKKHEDEILQQQQESLLMRLEDERSMDVDKHIRDIKAWLLSVTGAKERALELTTTRDEREQKEIEDQIARERANHHVQRNEIFRKRKMDLLEEEEVDVCRLPKGDRDDEADRARGSCGKLLGQLLSLRKRIVKTMRMELLRREQLETFQSQYQKVEANLRESERLQRAYSRGGIAAGVLGCIPAQELKDIDASVAKQYVVLGTYQSVLKEREEIWDITVSHIQKLKIMISSKETELRETIREIRLQITALRKRARGTSAKSEGLAALRASVESETKTMKNRAKLLTHERSLLDSHDGLFFDSDIWQQGVTQRMSKDRFSQDLQVEQRILHREIEKNVEKMKLIDEALASNRMEGDNVEITTQKFGQIVHSSEERFDRMISKTVGQELREMVDAEQELKSSDSPGEARIPQNSVAEIIRNKSSHNRNVEEKQWVALDILINQHLYQGLSVVENEELQLNDEYKTELQAEDVTRILGLPHEIQLALPHMKSAAEVDAHKLLTTFTLEHGDAEFAKADEQSQDHVLYAPPVEINQSTDLHGVPPGEGSEAHVASGIEERLLHSPTKRHNDMVKTCKQVKSLPTLSSSFPNEDVSADDRGRFLSSSPSTACTPVEHVGPTPPKFAPWVYEGATKPLTLVKAVSDVMIAKMHGNDGEIAIRKGEREIYRSPESFLGSQQSRVHSFDIADVPPTFSVDLKVVLTFTGCMDSRGFNMGRLSAVLRRKPGYAGELESSGGESVGYAPHSRQKVNTGDQFYQTPGTILIQHCPRRAPLAYRAYEVEVTAQGPTEYSMVVIAGQCELCASLMKERLEEARSLKERLRELENEQRDTWEGVRLRERQYHVCNNLIEEAGAECVRCQEDIDDLCEYLRPRNTGIRLGSLLEPRLSIDPSSVGSKTSSPSSKSATESPTVLTSSTSSTSSSSVTSSDLSEKELTETWNEIAAIETEHMHWGRLFTTRCQEKASVKHALDGLMKRRRDGRAEKVRLEQQLQRLSEEIPIVIEVLHGPSAAAAISSELRSGKRCGQPSSSNEGVSHLNVSLQTPAGKIRQVFEKDGWGVLTLEEQQWLTLDRIMSPAKYEWLQNHQEKLPRDFERANHVFTRARKNPAFDQYRYRRDDLVRIMEESSDNLNRNEKRVRKLLHKFHDNHRAARPSCPSVVAEVPNSSLAERTRLKDNHRRTATEMEWISLDKILNPMIWRRAKGGVPGTRNDQRPCEATDGHTLSNVQGWVCPFTREELLQIWAQREENSLGTEDEKRAFKLLTTYNGTFQGVPQSVNPGWQGIQMGKGTKGLDLDIDQRIRCLQRELDRVAQNNNPTMISSMLHAAPQRYTTSTLRLHLEDEIDRLLGEQPTLSKLVAKGRDGETTAVKKSEALHKVKQRERKNVYLMEDLSSSEEEEAHIEGRKKSNRRARRSRRRTDGVNMNIFDARKHMLLESKKTPVERENARQIANLGPGGCPACMSNPCKHEPVVNLEDTKSRLERIADELHFARISTENTIESYLPMSVQRDGNTSFLRGDLIEELTTERNHLRHMMKLHLIDEEFHEANRTPKQHVECVALHGYRTLLWTKDARVALEREHSRLVARAVAVEVTHDILEWMLEGWYFGECPSRHPNPECAPGRQGRGLAEADVDTEGTDALAGDERTLQEEQEDQVSMFTLPPGVPGSRWSKTSERVVKKGGVHDQEIGFMERTMRFGLFCIVVMYFRARWLLHLQREQASELKLGWKIDTSVPVRAQRKHTSQSAVRSTQAGYQRVKVRKEKEQAEVLADFAGFIAVEKREIDASQLIQRILRGHIGRKAAYRWREKRAEYNATNSLMVSAAVSIQRLLRGSWGRRRAWTIRAGIARWLAHLIDDEAREFETEILSTNKLEAMKRKIEELAEDTDRDD